MHITKDMLRTDLPEVVLTGPRQGCNSVLALRADSTFCPSNDYMSMWDISNTVWYRAHPEEFQGWIGLEFLEPEYEPCEEDCSKCPKTSGE